MHYRINLVNIHQITKVMFKYYSIHFVDARDVLEPDKIQIHWIWILYFKWVRSGLLTRSQLV